MKSTKVLIIGTNNKQTGGIQNYITNQRKNLSKEYNCSIYDVGAPNGSGYLWFVKSIILSAIDMLIFPFQSRPDIAHIHTSQDHSFFRSSFYVFFVSYIWRRPVILHIHGPNFDQFVETDSRLMSYYQKLVFSAADRIIVLGGYWRDKLTKYIEADKIRIIPNAISPREYTPKYNINTPCITFISDAVERKGILDLIEAIENINKKGEYSYTVELGGKGELESELELLSQKHSNVKYHGYVTEKKKRFLFNNSTITILPSYAEGLPIVILEAMAGGNAIISTTVGSIPEIIDDSGGRLVQPGDVSDLTNKIEELLDNQDLTQTMGQQNRKAVEENYTWKIVSEKLGDLYTELE